MQNESFKKIIEEYRKGNVKFNISLNAKGKIINCRAFSFPLLLGREFKNTGFAVTKNGYEIKGKEFSKLIENNKKLLTIKELDSFKYPIKSTKKEMER